jgi:hypothetical protein
MRELNLTPSPQDVAKFGPLAYVQQQERERILSLLFGASIREIKLLEDALKEADNREELHAREMQKAAHAMPSGGVRREMTPVERKWVEKLQHVRFPLQSKDPSFVSAMSSFPPITEKQAAFIKLLVFKYRRQI